MPGPVTEPVEVDTALAVTLDLPDASVALTWEVDPVPAVREHTYETPLVLETDGDVQLI